MERIADALELLFDGFITFAFGFVLGAILTSIAYYKEKGK